MLPIFTKRFYWNTGVVGDGSGYSSKLSIKIGADWRSLFIGLRIIPDQWGHRRVRLQIVPGLLGVEVHLARSYGGRYVS